MERVGSRGGPGGAPDAIFAAPEVAEKSSENLRAEKTPGNRQIFAQGCQMRDFGFIFGWFSASFVHGISKTPKTHILQQVQANIAFLAPGSLSFRFHISIKNSIA